MEEGPKVHRVCDLPKLIQRGVVALKGGKERACPRWGSRGVLGRRAGGQPTWQSPA